MSENHKVEVCGVRYTVPDDGILEHHKKEYLKFLILLGLDTWKQRGQTVFATEELYRQHKAVEEFGENFLKQLESGTQISLITQIDEQKEDESQTKIVNIINLISELTPMDLDNCSVQGLCQLHYWLQKWTGSIFVKTVGRLAGDR